MFRRVLAISAAVFTDAVRMRVVYVVGVFAIVMAMATPSLPSYGLGVASALYREITQAVAFGAALVVTVTIAVTRIPGEIERRTVYNVLTRPVARWEYVVGVWAGTFAVTGAILIPFTVIEQLIGVWRYGQPMWLLWQGAFATWLEMGVIAAFAVAVSTVVSPVTVVIATLAFLFIGHSRSGLFGEKPTTILAALYPSLDTFNIINPVAHGGGVGLLYVAGMLLAFAGWVVAVLLLGSLAFSRRDL